MISVCATISEQNKMLLLAKSSASLLSLSAIQSSHLSRKDVILKSHIRSKTRSMFLFIEIVFCPALNLGDRVALLLPCLSDHLVPLALKNLLDFTYLLHPKWRCTLRRAVRHSLVIYHGFPCGVCKKENDWPMCPAFGEQRWCPLTGQSFDPSHGPLAEFSVLQLTDALGVHRLYIAGPWWITDASCLWYFPHFAYCSIGLLYRIHS